MYTSLSPTYQKLFGEHWVFWYAVSNSYSVVDLEFKLLLDAFLNAKTKAEFESKLLNIDKVSSVDSIIDNLTNYLEASNIMLTSEIKDSVVIDTKFRNISKHYNFNGKTVRIYYNSEVVSKLVHPALVNYCLTSENKVETTFDIYLKNDNLYLFRDEQLITCVPKKDYHLLQGKFIMHLLCTIHDKKVEDWISTFHGSTLTDGNNSILFIGESGKGKSTLCALLTANGFDLLADDVSPMLSENKNIYFNPSAISIKEGAFELLEPIVDNFNILPITQFNKSKGPIKYVPCSRPKYNHFPCKALVLVNFKKNAKTQLETASIKTLLETLIPDSWLSPKPLHANQFLDWLETVNTYKLTYSDTKSVTMEISELFKQLNKN